MRPTAAIVTAIALGLLAVLTSGNHHNNGSGNGFGNGTNNGSGNGSGNGTNNSTDGNSTTCADKGQMACPSYPDDCIPEHW